MSKRTLILIAFLTILTAFFVYLAVSQNQPRKTAVTSLTPTPKPVPAYTTLMLSPQNLPLSSNSGSLEVMIDTGTGSKTNTITAVQLEMQYDPKMITNVVVTPGTFIAGGVPLVNTVDKVTGRVTYALAIQPSGSGKSGKGVVATIQFQSLVPKGGTTELSLLPTTLVTAQGIAESVFLKGTGATISSGTPIVSISPTVAQSTSSAPLPKN